MLWLLRAQGNGRRAQVNDIDGGRVAEGTVQSRKADDIGGAACRGRVPSVAAAVVRVSSEGCVQGLGEFAAPAGGGGSEAEAMLDGVEARWDEQFGRGGLGGVDEFAGGVGGPHEAGAASVMDGDDGVAGGEVGEGVDLEAADGGERDAEGEGDALGGGDADAEGSVRARADIHGDGGEGVAGDGGVPEDSLDVGEEFAGGGGGDAPVAVGEDAVAIEDGDGGVIGGGVDAEVDHGGQYGVAAINTQGDGSNGFIRAAN